MWKNPLPKIEIRQVSAAAIASGTGAALGYMLIPWWWIFPVIVFTVLLPRRKITAFILWFALSLGSGAVHRDIDNSHAAMIPSRAQRMSGEIICIDRRTTAVESLANPTVLTCEIHTGGTMFEAAVIFPREFDKRVLYGDKFSFNGRFFPAKTAGVKFDGSTFSGTLPPLYGERPLIIADEVSAMKTPSSPFRFFFRCRDIMLEQMLSGIDDPETGTMAAKMFFSASAGPPAHLRKNFINSGTYHLFSVSGIHVTVLAGMLLLLLRPLPFAWRYRATALLIAFYVLCTGASVPAIRAGTMVFIWCIMRSMLYYAPGWNAMMLTWCAFAFLSPATLASLGTQYSFGITAALIMLIDKLKQWHEADRRILELMPPKAALTRQTRRRIRFKHHIIALAAVALTAFAASAGLSLLRQNLFIPGSILINLLLPLFTPLLFGALIFKLIAGAVFPFFNQAGAWTLQTVFDIMTDTVSTAADNFPPAATQPPPLWSVLLFYLLLFTALKCKRLKTFILCISAILIIMCLWPWSKSAAPDKIMVISHGANNPALLAYLPAGSDTAAIVDVSDPDTGRLAGEILRRNGYYNADVDFSRGIKNCSAGVQALSNQLDCRVFLPRTKRKSTKAFERQLGNPAITRINSYSGFNIYIPERDIVVWEISGNLTITSAATDDGRQITVKYTDRVTTVTIPWSSRPALWEFTLENE